LPLQTKMREMLRWPFDESMPPKRKIEWRPVCPLWWKSSSKLQRMYGLQRPTKENIPTPSSETIHSSCTNQTNITHSTRSNICSNNQTKYLCYHNYRARSTHKSTSPANQRHTRLKKYEKSFWANGNYAKAPYTRAY
jgi:hypothetical protein